MGRSFNTILMKFHRASYKILPPSRLFTVFLASTTTFAHRPRFLSYLVATFLLLTFRKNFSECNYAVHPLIGQHISPKQREFFRIIKFRSSAYRWQANKKNARDGKIRIENETIKITREFNIRII